MSDRKEAIVREELAFGASGLPVIWQGMQGSYAPSDKCWTHLSTKRNLKRDSLGHGKNSRLIEVVCKYQGNEVFSMHLLTSYIYFTNLQMVFIKPFFSFNFLIENSS